MAKEKPVQNAPEPTPEPTTVPLRLEYRDPAELADNPANWRVHPDTQLRALADVINEVGFADALLFNERTGRLLDGHARKKVAKPGEKVPVLIGSWTEEQERIILATLDSSTGMAKADPAALDKLLQELTLSSHDMLNHLEELRRQAEALAQDEADDDATDGDAKVEQMELLPFEHYDYVLVVSRNINDWNFLQEFCGLKKVNSCPVQGKKKIGLGRAVEASDFIRRLKDAIQDSRAEPPPGDADESALKADPRRPDLRG